MKTHCKYCKRPIKAGHKNKEFCTPGVDEGRACRQMAYLKRRSKKHV